MPRILLQLTLVDTTPALTQEADGGRLLTPFGRWLRELLRSGEFAPAALVIERQVFAGHAVVVVLRLDSEVLPLAAAVTASRLLREVIEERGGAAGWWNGAGSIWRDHQSVVVVGAPPVRSGRAPAAPAPRARRGRSSTMPRAPGQ
ncbi:MAG: hypothetical protein ABJC19_10655 [Gemmatimonadota bacterium]